MDVTNTLNNYQNATSATKNAANPNSKTGKSSTKDAYSMGMQQFISLMVAQLKNQDMMNPTSDTEFVSQMAQFSSLQAVSNLEESVGMLQQTYNTSYATSLMGKNVVVAAVNEKNEVTTLEGVVTGVTLFEGQPVIYIGDKGYALSQIMVVGDAGAANKPKPDVKPDPDPDVKPDPKPETDPKPDVKPDPPVTDGTDKPEPPKTDETVKSTV